MNQPVTMGQALWRGFLGRCPNCGIGKMFRKFLKVADDCPHCGEALHHHRADDLPAYILILVLGHILVPLVVTVELLYQPSYWFYLAVVLPLTLALAIGLLQPIKGTIVALQWKMGMHGFHRKPNHPK
ncbi:MAG: DUF983 domain-containing protein [Gallionella sp.]